MLFFCMNTFKIKINLYLSNVTAGITAGIIILFNKKFLRAYFVPDIVPGTGKM